MRVKKVRMLVKRHSWTILHQRFVILSFIRIIIYFVVILVLVSSLLLFRFKVILTSTYVSAGFFFFWERGVIIRWLNWGIYSYNILYTVFSAGCWFWIVLWSNTILNRVGVWAYIFFRNNCIYANVRYQQLWNLLQFEPLPKTSAGDNRRESVLWRFE